LEIRLTASMQAPTDSVSVRVLRRLSNPVHRYPRLVFYPQLLLFVVSIAYTVAQLQFDTSRSDLVGAEQRYHQNFQRYKKEFNSQDELVAVVESEDMEKNRQFVERLGARLAAETNLFTDAIFNNDVTCWETRRCCFSRKRP
jgi:Predicted exporters of the RND superfamily